MVAAAKSGFVKDADAAALVEQVQIQTNLLLEEQAALVDVLAELFPGVMIARLSVPSLEYTFANAAFCLRFGELKRRDAAASNKVIGRTLSQVRGQDAASTLRPHIETCLQGRQLSFQTRVPAPPPLPPYMFNADTDQEEEMQATLIPDVEASTGRVRGLFEVIQTSSKSERRLTAEELEYQAHITQTITQNAASCLFMMDHKGFPTFMNLAAERVTGYTLDEIKDKPLHYAIHWKRPDNTFYPMEECPIDNSTAELVAAQEVEEVFVRKDGTIFPVICAVAPLSKSGRTVGAVIEFRDVTEERRRENERLSALRDAEEHQRRRAAEAEAFRVKQERFIDTICHEIRNPINGIYGNVTLLQDELASVHAQLEGVEWPAKPQMCESLRQMEICVNAISTCAKHQKVITDDVLHLSKLEANKIELNRVIYNPMEVIKSAASMFMSQIQEKKLTLQVNDPTPLPSSLPDEKPVLVVRGDPDRFMQVVVNLLSNGIKFTHRGGITVSAYYLHRENRDTTELRIEVADTGIGMSHEEQSRIFDRFSQASHKTYREYGGSGLGLSIAKGLVALMGGVLDVRSRKGAGSTFHFTMECGYVTPSQLEEHNRAKEKLKENQARQSQELTLSANSKPMTPKRILVAEDNSINKRVILRFLERRGHYCEAADNGEEALSIYLDAVAKGRRFDLIFMDIEMPVMDGLAATQVIRERERMLNLPSTPVIGLSGNSRQQQISRALKGGMSDYITKPYEQHTIYSKLAQWTTDTPLGSPHAEARAASPGRPDDDDEEARGAGTATATTTTTTQQENEEGKEKEKEEVKGKDGKKDEEDGEEGEKEGDDGRRKRRQGRRRKSVVDNDGDDDNDDDEEEREPPPPSSPPTSEEDSIAEVGEEEHRGVGRR